VPFPELIDELVELIEEDAGVLRCLTQVERARATVVEGTSSQRQRTVYRDALIAEDDHDHAMGAVVRHLIEEFHDGL